MDKCAMQGQGEGREEVAGAPGYTPGDIAVQRGCGAPGPRAAASVTSGHDTRAKEEERNTSLMGVQGIVPEKGLWGCSNCKGCGGGDSGRGRGQSQK